MTLSADAQAKIDRSLAALSGERAAPARGSTQDVTHPLAWTGTDYQRHEVRPADLLDAFDDELPRQDPAPGWSVVSLRHLDCDASGTDGEGRAITYGRSGVVLDTEDAHDDPETGERRPTTLHLATLPTGDGARSKGLHHLGVVWPDEVEAATPPDHRFVGEVLACAYRELARGRARGDRRAWLSGVVTRLEAVRSAKGWA